MFSYAQNTTIHGSYLLDVTTIKNEAFESMMLLIGRD